MSLHDEQRVTASNKVLSRVFDGDAVLLDLGSGSYFGLNEVGSCIWQALERGATVAELLAAVLAGFEVDEETARRDLSALLEDLSARGLIAAV